jgi:hypothetical protein
MKEDTTVRAQTSHTLSLLFVFACFCNMFSRHFFLAFFSDFAKVFSVDCCIFAGRHMEGTDNGRWDLRLLFAFFFSVRMMLSREPRRLAFNHTCAHIIDSFL